MTAHTYRSSKPTEELGSGASATPTAAFVASPSSPSGLDQRLQSTSEALLDLADRCETAMAPDRELELAIWRIVDPKAASIEADGKQPLAWLHRYTSSLDTAMTLLAPVPWLCPIMDFSERTVRLVNGIGLPVNGKDYASRAETVPLALCAAALRAQAAGAA